MRIIHLYFSRLNITLKNNYFEFKNEFYIQEYVSIGSQCSSILSEIYLQFMEENYE